MAPLKGAGKKPSSYKRSKNTTTRPIPPGAKNKVSKGPKASKPVQQKTKSKSSLLNKKRKVYTDKELGLPKLNMITPVGVDLPKGKKKGKVFVDDQESMMAILAIVNASKDGQIESKMMKARHMEEIREARRKEAEVRQEQKKSKLEETKDSLRRKRKRKLDPDHDEVTLKSRDAEPRVKTARKQVSFA